MFRRNRPVVLTPRSLVPFRPGDKVVHLKPLPANSRPDARSTGIVKRISRRTNEALVEGVNMRSSATKASLQNPTPTRFKYEEAVPFSSLKLIHPTAQTAVDVRMVEAFDPKIGGTRLAREVVAEYNVETGVSNTQSPLVGSLIPFSIPQNDRREHRSRDITPSELASERTFQPNVLETPFPVQFMNELNRMRRKGNERYAFI